MKTPVPRVGNKTPVLQTLYSMFPIRYKEYIDVFGGSGSVLLGLDRMTKVDREIYNDFDHNLTNLFNCMKYRTMALIWELGFCHLNSREDFLAIEHFFQSEAFDDRFFINEQELTKIMLPPLEAEELNRIRASRVEDYDVRRAAMYFKLLRESYASTGKSYAAQPFDITKLFDTIKMVQYRLKDVVIENQDFETSISRKLSPITTTATISAIALRVSLTNSALTTFFMSLPILFTASSMTADFPMLTRI